MVKVMECVDGCHHRISFAKVILSSINHIWVEVISDDTQTNARQQLHGHGTWQADRQGGKVTQISKLICM